MEGFFFNKRLVHLASDESVLLFHPHAARTGGRVFRETVLSRAYGRKRVYCRQHVPDVKPWTRLKDEDLREYRAYTDLTDFRPLHLSRPVIGVAVLRDPVYRAISLYQFIRRKKEHRHYAQAQRHSLEDFFRIVPREDPVYFNNVQCRRICSSTDAEHALAFLRTYYIAAGFTNRLPEFVTALGGLLGWPSVALQVKAPDEERYAGQISESFREMVVAQNAQDVALFEAVSRGAVPESTRPVLRSVRYVTTRVHNLAAGAGRRLARLLNGEAAAPPTAGGTGEMAGNRTCGICGFAQPGGPSTPVERLCPKCGASERQRCLQILFDTVLAERLEHANRDDLLLLSPGGVERKLLEPLFQHTTISSMYNINYTGHFVQANLRDLAPFADASFDFAQACGVLEFVPEIDEALGSVSRVLRPGGIFCLHINDGRLFPGAEPIEVRYLKKVKMKYYPEGMPVPSVKLGRDTLAALLTKNGLGSESLAIVDPLTGTICTWWLCTKLPVQNR